MTIDNGRGFLFANEAAPDGGSEGVELVTRTGYAFQVRPACDSDEPALSDFFGHFTPDDLRFRFLSSVRQVSQSQLALLSHVDHRQTENFLALDMGVGCIVASAMLAADPDMEKAEVAIAVRSDFKGRGIGWTLLEHVTRSAEARGIKLLRSVESQDNHSAIELEREMGFTARPCPGDGTLVIVERGLGKAEEP